MGTKTRLRKVRQAVSRTGAKAKSAASQLTPKAIRKRRRRKLQKEVAKEIITAGVKMGAAQAADYVARRQQERRVPERQAAGTASSGKGTDDPEA